MGVLGSGREALAKLEIPAEHGQEVFFEAHHQGADPGIEDDIRPFEAHLRGIAGG